MKKWIFPQQTEQEFLEKFSVCDSETFHFELLDKSQIRSIHYLNHSTHFNPKLYEKFISSKWARNKYFKFFEIKGFKDNLQEQEPLIKNEDLKEDQNLNESKDYFEYTVENEDSLIGIALKFDVNMQILENLNKISEGNLYPNQVFLSFFPKKQSNAGFWH